MSTVKAIIEMPANSSYKYEIDKETGLVMLDRVLDISTPFNYGYIPETLFDDGDPLDIFIISKYPIPSKTLVNVELLGIFTAVDNGQRDDKLVGVVLGEQAPFHFIHQIKQYLTLYKKGFEVLQYYEDDYAALTTVFDAEHSYNKAKNNE